MIDNNELLSSYKIISLLEEACEYSERILDGISSVFVVLNGQNKIIRANNAFCELVGRSPDECLHLDFTEIFDPENRKILHHHLSQTRTGESANGQAHLKLEVTPRENSDQRLQFYWTLLPAPIESTAEGNIVYVIGEDMTEVYQSEMKLTNIFAVIPLGLLIVNKTGCIDEILSEYCHVLLHKRDLLGKHIQDILDGCDLSRMISSIGQTKVTYNAIAGRLPRQVSIPSPNSSQPENWVKISYQPIIKNDVIDRYMLILEDETESVLAGREKQRLDILEKQTLALYEVATRDPLSGLYTRLFMKDSVKSLVDTFHRGNIQELALVMFDIDHFKSINDTYGHSSGDVVIRTVGDIILKNSRKSNIAVRYGGEEFIVILPSNTTGNKSGAIFAERVRKELERREIRVKDQQKIKVTISCGVAYCKADEEIESLIERADQYLYQAKKSGRNKVCSE